MGWGVVERSGACDLCVFSSSSCRIFLMQHAVVREASPGPLVFLFFLTDLYYETRTNDVAVATEAAPAFVLPPFSSPVPPHPQLP